MKKSVFYQLALAIGLVSASSAFGQYPFNNVGPSSFPVQNQQAMQGPQQGFQNLPQVPQQFNQQAYGGPTYAVQQGMPSQQPTAAYQQTNAQPSMPMAQQQQQYQLVGMQDQPGGVYTVPPPANTALPPVNSSPAQHAPMSNATSQGCSSCGPESAPVMNYGYAQNIAPNCTSCGPAPVSQPNNFGPCNSNGCGPVAYNAPGWNGPGWNGPGYAAQPGHFGGRLAGVAGMPAGAKPWFFGGSYLRYNRVDDRNRPLSLRDADLADVLSTGDAQMNSMSGFEVMGGRYFNCGKNAIQASYWGLYPSTETASVLGGTAGEFRSRILSLNDVILPVNQTGAVTPYDAYTWYDNAYLHQVTRSSEFHNVEVNLLGFAVGCASRNFNRPTAGTLFSGTRQGCGYCGGAGCGSCAAQNSSKYATGPTGYVSPDCGSRLNLSWLGGFRYFRFEDNLQYAASFNNDGITRAVDDIYYNVNTTNDLVGIQIGGRADYCVTKKINAYGTGKVGVYNNRANLYSRLGTDTAVGYDAAMPTVNYLVDTTDNRIAFLSELGSGVGVRLSPKWTATFGYQAVIASGVATSVGNVRHPRDYVRDQRCIDNTDTLILHGFKLGALYNF